MKKRLDNVTFLSYYEITIKITETKGGNMDLKNVAINKNTHNELKVFCAKNDKSMAEVTNKALINHMKKKGK